MTGWRVGYIAAPEWLAKACVKLQGQVTSGICSVAQKAATAALNGGLDSPKQMTEAYRRRRDMFISELSKIEGLNVSNPDGAFYVFADVTAFLGKTAEDGTEIKKSSDLALYLLSNALVAAVSGDSFGNPECIRFSFATSDELLKKAAERIKVALESLK